MLNTINYSAGCEIDIVDSESGDKLVTNCPIVDRKCFGIPLDADSEDESHLIVRVNWLQKYWLWQFERLKPSGKPIVLVETQSAIN